MMPMASDRADALDGYTDTPLKCFASSCVAPFFYLFKNSGAKSRTRNEVLTSKKYLKGVQIPNEKFDSLHSGAGDDEERVTRHGGYIIPTCTILTGNFSSTIKFSNPDHVISSSLPYLRAIYDAQVSRCIEE
jgi:hypothetical protein